MRMIPCILKSYSYFWPSSVASSCLPQMVFVMKLITENELKKKGSNLSIQINIPFFLSSFIFLLGSHTGGRYKSNEVKPIVRLAWAGSYSVFPCLPCKLLVQIVSKYCLWYMNASEFSFKILQTNKLWIIDFLADGYLLTWTSSTSSFSKI